MADEKDGEDNTHKRHMDDGSPNGKRSKREWLAYHGTKHTRVGAEFQVATLPVPEKIAKGKEDEEEEESKKEVQPDEAE